MQRSRSLWAYYPWFMAAAMLLVMGVNIAFIVGSVRSFPGAAGDDGFALSNAYDRVLDAAAAQRALGWKIEAKVSEGGIALHLAGRDGKPLTQPVVIATASRLLGPPDAHVLDFATSTAGTLFATAPLASGQWEIAFRVQSQGHEANVMRRVVMP